jgi:hypothetical protein
MKTNVVCSFVFQPLAMDLVACMTHAQPAQRPTAAECLQHPQFWSLEKRLQFLLDVSDRAEDEPKDGPLKLQLEYKAEEVVGPNWMERLCPELASNLNEGVRRKYATSSVRDCLRVIRNKKHHYHELPAATQRSLGSMPDGFYQYFAVRFPQLLLHAYACMASFVQLDPLASAPASSMGDAQFVKYYLHMSLGRHAQLRIKAGFACRCLTTSSHAFEP